MYKYHNIVHNLNQREISFNKFYSNVDQIVRSAFGLTDKLYRTDLYFHRGCVNFIKFSDNGEHMISGGDDMIVTMWNVEQSLMKKYKPKRMKMKHRGNIFCLEFNNNNDRIFSGGTDEQLIIHQSETGDLVTSRFLDSAICDISLNPKDDNVIAVGCEDRMVLFDCRTNVAEYTLSSLGSDSYDSFKSIQYNPSNSNLLLVASNCEKDVSLIDLRNKKTVYQYLSPFSCLKGAMCARYNRKGDQFLVTRPRLSVSLYNSNCPNELCEFDSFGFFNTITQKRVCFAGPNDEYAACTSDDFNIYLYKIPEDLKYTAPNDSKRTIRFIDSADFTLKGHKSIVNQVAYNYQRSILASSGVENVIKYWSPFPLNLDEEESKENFSTTPNERQINTFPRIARVVLIDLNEDNIEANHEDEAVLGYFDKLIRNNLRDEEFEDFIDLDTALFENFKIVDPNFEHDLHYINSLISDFKQNGENQHENLLKKLNIEKLISQKETNENIVKTGSLSYLFNYKKIQQSKLILKRAYKSIQERLRFIRKCKKEENFNDENWLENVQRMIDHEPELKEMLIDLNKLYKEKKLLENISFPLYVDILERLDKLFLETSSIRLYIQSELEYVNDSDSTDIDEVINEINNITNSDNDEVQNNNLNPPANQNSRQNNESTTDHDEDNRTSTDSSSLRSFVSSNSTLSDDTSLSSSSLFSDEETNYDLKSNNEEKKNLKRKKSHKSSNSKYLKKNKSDNEFKNKVPSNPLDFSLSSSSTSDSNDDRPILKFKKSNQAEEKTKKYNLHAFDEDLDLNTSSSDNLIKAECSNSTSKKRSIESIEQELLEDFKKGMKKSTSSIWNLKDRYSTSSDSSENELLN